jgi:hypothetical protein
MCKCDTKFVMCGRNTFVFRHISSFKFGARAFECRLEVIICAEGPATKFLSIFSGSRRWCSRLSHCTRDRKVAGSTPHGGLAIFLT